MSYVEVFAGSYYNFLSNKTRLGMEVEEVPYLRPHCFYYMWPGSTTLLFPWAVLTEMRGDGRWSLRYPTSVRQFTRDWLSSRGPGGALAQTVKGACRRCPGIIGGMRPAGEFAYSQVGYAGAPLRSNVYTSSLDLKNNPLDLNNRTFPTTFSHAGTASQGRTEGRYGGTGSPGHACRGLRSSRCGRQP